MPEPITLVLGGMGVKGVASIGILQTLRKHRVKIKKIIATGISGAVSIQWALGKNPDALTDIVTQFFYLNRRSIWGLEQLTGLLLSRRRRILGNFSHFLRERNYCRASLKHSGVLPWELLDPQINTLFGNKTFLSLKVPVVISAIDLKCPRVTLLEQGSLVEAVKASIAFPGLLPPVKIGNTELVSSTIFCELPLQHIRKEDAPVVTVDFPGTIYGTNIHSLLEIISTVDEIRNQAIKERLLTKADYVFRFERIRRFYLGNYEQIPQIVEHARSETERMLKDGSLP